jgi:hypothetical protein
VAALGVLAACRDDHAVAPGVTARAIRTLRIGMTEAEVVETLGAPLSVKADQNGSLKTLEFTRAVRARSFPMLWVHLTNGRVTEVYAKKYVWWGFDDEGLYGLSSSGHWESPGFEKSFTR